MFSFGQSDIELKKSLSKYNIEWKDNMKLSSVGKYIMLDNNQSIIRLDRIPETCADYGTLSHEIFHSVDTIFRFIGMNLTEDSDESYAYMIGYLTTQIYTRF